MNVPGMWDMGRNHKRVMAFIIHFKNLLNEKTDEQIKALKEKIKEKERKEVYIHTGKTNTTKHNRKTQSLFTDNWRRGYRINIGWYFNFYFFEIIHHWIVGSWYWFCFRFCV